MSRRSLRRATGITSATRLEIDELVLDLQTRKVERAGHRLTFSLWSFYYWNT
ncbi:MAG: hypothetical protein R2874_07945 [Desulfobacterales bacterium]